MFLLERAHVIRAPFIRKRTDDWVWVGGTLFVFVTFGAISIWGLVTPHAELSPEDGQCRIGLAKVPAYLLLVFDAFINAALTLLFVFLLRPVLEFRKRTSTYHDNENPPPSFGRFRKAIRQLRSLGFREDEGNDRFSANIRKVLRKNVIGSSVSFLASAANLAVFLSHESSQLAFVCLVSCMADGKPFISTLLVAPDSNTCTVTCGVLVVHWLTLGSIEETHLPPRPSRSHTPSLSSLSTIAAVSKPENTVKPSKSER
jgi:hypothetical protein